MLVTNAEEFRIGTKEVAQNAGNHISEVLDFKCEVSGPPTNARSQALVSVRAGSAPASKFSLPSLRWQTEKEFGNTWKRDC